MKFHLPKRILVSATLKFQFCFLDFFASTDKSFISGQGHNTT